MLIVMVRDGGCIDDCMIINLMELDRQNPDHSLRRIWTENMGLLEACTTQNEQLVTQAISQFYNPFKL